MTLTTEFTLYARYTNTQDSVLLDNFKKYPKPALRYPYHYDVTVSKDKAGKDIVCIYQWHRESKPTKRNKYLYHNCFRYRLAWVD